VRPKNPGRGRTRLSPRSARPCRGVKLFIANGLPYERRLNGGWIHSYRLAGTKFKSKISANPGKILDGNTSILEESIMWLNDQKP